MFKSIGLEISAFFSDPLHYLADSGNAVIEYQVNQMVKEGKTAAEIDERLKENGLLKGPGALKVIVDGAVDTLQFALDNLPKILLALVLMYLAWWILRIREAVKT